MAINRFYQSPQLDMSFQVYNPVKWQPNMQLWGKVFGEKQQELNTIRDLRSPEHIEESDDAVKTQMGKIRSARDKVIEAYKSGNLSEAVKMQSDLVGDVRRAVQPGGWFYDEEALYKKAIKTKEDLDELLKDSPVHWKQEAYKRITREGSTIDADGNYKVGSVGAPTWAAYQDIPEYLFEALDGFKADGGTFQYSSKDGKIVYYGTKEEVPYDQVYSAAMKLANQPRFGHQIKIEAERLGFDATTVTDDTKTTIDGLKNGLSTKRGIAEVQGYLSKAGLYKGPINGILNDDLNNAITDYETKLLARDPMQLAMTTILDNYVKPVADAYSYQKVTNFNLKFDPYKLKAWEYHYKREQDAMHQNMLRTMVAENNTGMDAWDTLGFKVDSDGRFAIKNINTDDQILREKGGTWGAYYIAPREAIWAPQGASVQEYFANNRDNVPKEILNIYDNNKDYLSNLSNKEALDFIKTKYEEKRDVLAQNRGYYYPFTGPKLKKENEEIVIGTVNGSGEDAIGTPGTISSSLIYVHNPATQMIEQMPFEDFKKTYFGNDKNSTKDLINGVTLLGNLDPRNRFSKGGYYGQFVDKDGTVRPIYINNDNSENGQYEIEAFTFTQPVFSANVDMSSSQASSIYRDANGNPLRLKSVAKDRYTMDLIRESGYFDLVAIRESNPNGLTEADKDVLKQWDETYEKIQEDPLNNKYIGREAYMYDANNNPFMMSDNGAPVHVSVSMYIQQLQSFHGISGSMGPSALPYVGRYSN